MPISVVVGGQFGSEGKGKVTHHLAAERDAAAVIRVGGPNSGHTSIGPGGTPEVLQQLPMAALLEHPHCLIGPGSYVDPQILLAEIERFDIDPGRIIVDYRAMVLTDEHRGAEAAGDLGARIGSTNSGTGAAVARRVSRSAADDLAFHNAKLRPFLGDTATRARELLREARRVIVEGTQGFGLSLLHSPHYPFVTSRDTSAAGALSEAGLSPLDVDEVALVLRSFPIRVAGSSGPFDAEEIDWETVAREGGLDQVPEELSSVTRRTRRVARFSPGIVRAAIEVNAPSRIFLNHIDYVDGHCGSGAITDSAQGFIESIEDSIGAKIDMVGFGPRPGDLISPRQRVGDHAT
jgi:adenylosuccinate synthase